MDNIKKRIILFLVCCIGIRLFMVYLAKNMSPEKLKIFGYITLLPAFGFLIIYLFDLRKTGPEVFGENIWWNDLRPIHSLLYFMFSYHAINNYNNAWIFLFIDVIIGLISFIIHHIS
jgi:hypothetical protein